MCSRFLLNVLRCIYLEYSPYSSSWDCFQYVLYDKYNNFRYNLCHKYDKIHYRMHQIAALKKNLRGSMPALAFIPLRGLAVKESNSLLAFG